MSIWFQRRDKDGIEARYSVTVPLEIVLVVLTLIAAFIGPRYFGDNTLLVTDAFILLVVGLSLFLASKIPVFKKGVFNTWGSKNMSPIFKWAYWVGYGAMILGGVLVLAAARIA
jgi:hypothetical protein